MSKQLKFEDPHEFVSKLKDLVESGVDPKNIDVFTPYHVHETEEILRKKKSPVRFFTLFGALLGLVFGFWFTIWTSLDWPLIGGGKPIVSIPAFVIIAFELTVLLGGTVSLLGFLILARLPSIKRIISPEEYGNQFVIHIQNEGR